MLSLPKEMLLEFTTLPKFATIDKKKSVQAATAGKTIIAFNYRTRKRTREDDDVNKEAELRSKQPATSSAGEVVSLSKQIPAKKKEQESKSFVGRRVAKFFPDYDAVFLGTVAAWYPPVENEDETESWLVHYDDGDKEDFSREELREALVLYKEEQDDKATSDDKIRSSE